MPDRSDGLLKLATEHFDEIIPAEKKFFRAVAKGVFVDYRVDDEKENDPEKGDTWGKKRTLRADCISWLCTDDKAKHFVRQSGIQIRGARIVEPLMLVFAQLNFPLSFFGCRIMENIDLRHSMVRGLFFDGSHVKKLAADGARIEGPLHLRNGFRTEGEVRLLGATIGSNLDCSKGRFLNPDGEALNADNLDVEGSVFLKDDFEAQGGVRLLRASIGGDLGCNKGRFLNPKGNALNAAGLNVEGSVFLNEDFEALGEVSLLGATLGSTLECSNGRFLNPDGKALTADRLNVKGSVFLKDDFEAQGEVRLLGAAIGSNLECSNGRFLNPDGKALTADSLNVKGDVHLQQEFCAEGAVRFLGAHIGGSLFCSGGNFKSREQPALDLENATVGGNLIIRAEEENPPKIEGLVDLNGASVFRAFIWRDLEKPEQASLDLRHAKIGVLFDQPDSWPVPGKLALDGLTYDRIDQLQADHIKSRLEWIRRSQPGVYTPQPYEQLAKVLKESGFEKDAQDVLIAKNDSYVKHAPVSRGAKIRRWVFGRLLGYGYRPWQAVSWLLGFWLVGLVLFQFGRQMDVMLPTQDKDLTIDTTSGRYIISDAYPKFVAPIYALDAFIPLINLHQVTYWLPVARNICGVIILAYFCFHIIFGWVLVSMFLVGLTGMLKR